MENRTNKEKRFHAATITQNVFIEDERIFLKKEAQEVFLEQIPVAEWFPTDFKQILAKQ